jgi:predicted O-methyltransferase YrrM
MAPSGMPTSADDPFAKVRAQTLRHRAQHGCGTYPFDGGAILGVIAAAVAPRRVLELGTALGYTSLWFAHGAPDARIDTIELDPVHVRLARENFAACGVAARVTVHPGDFAAVLPTLEAGYDLAFFDGFSPTPDYLRAFRKLLRPRGVLISSNLHFLDAETRAYRDLLFGGGQWLTAAISDGDTAMSVRL